MLISLANLRLLRPKNYQHMKSKKIVFTIASCFLYLYSFAQIQTGKASFYADKFEGIPTASGEKYRHNKLTGAHKTLPFGTKVRITNLANDKTVEVTKIGRAHV